MGAHRMKPYSRRARNQKKHSKTTRSGSQAPNRHHRITLRHPIFARRQAFRHPRFQGTPTFRFSATRRHSGIYCLPPGGSQAPNLKPHGGIQKPALSGTQFSGRTAACRHPSSTARRHSGSPFYTARRHSGTQFLATRRHSDTHSFRHPMFGQIILHIIVAQGLAVIIWRGSIFMNSKNHR